MSFATPAKSKSGKYLFCYFVGNEPHEERIHFAVSEDGYNFTALNNNEPVIIQTKGKKCVRDPYIFKGQDNFYYIISFKFTAPTINKGTSGLKLNSWFEISRTVNL